LETPVCFAYALDPGRLTVVSPFGMGSSISLALAKWVYEIAVSEGRVTWIDDFFEATAR